MCRSADFTGFTGTVTHNTSATLTIGDATAGLGNVALTLVAGMTYTLNSATTSAISFVSTSVTQQTVAFGGRTHGNLTFNGAGGSWIFNDASTGVGTTTTLTAGTLNTNGQTCSWGIFSSNNSNTRVLTLGASSITLTSAGIAWNITTATNLTLNANTSTITLSGATTTFASAGRTYNVVVLTGSGVVTMNGQGANITFGTLTRTGTAATTDTFVITGTGLTTITGTLNLNGNSAINRLLLQSTALGTARTLTITGATVSASNLDIRDITFSVATDLSAITGLSGDCGGNSGITFTTAQTNYWVGGTGNWSTVGEWASTSGGVGGTGRVPFPQDDAVFDANSFSAGSLVVTRNMPRIGKNINWTGATNSPTWTTSVTSTVYGSITLISGMTNTMSDALTFEGRGAFTLTSAGKSWNRGVNVQMVGGTLTLQDAFVQSGGGGGFVVSHGTFNANNFNVTCLTFSANATTIRTVTMGSGTWTLTSTGTVWNTATTTNLTFNVNTSTITITNTSATARTFSGGGLTYNNFSSNAGASVASLTIAGSNTFAGFEDIGTAAHSILFTAGTTQTITTWTVSGSSGNAITINSTTTSTHALAKGGGGTVSSDWLNIQHSIATPASTWYAGTNSVDNQAVVTAGSGWIFTAPPSGDVGIVSQLTLLGVG